MRRRNFIKLAALGSVAVAVPSFGYIGISTREAAIDLVLNELDYLKIDRNEVKLFMADFYETFNKDESLYTGIQVKTLRLLKIKSNHSDRVAFLARQFLASTDFFLNKMDVSLPVKYIGLYNPYKTPCANPFSFLFYPSIAS